MASNRYTMLTSTRCAHRDKIRQVSYNTAIAACDKLRDGGAAVQLLVEAGQKSLPLDIFSYNSVMSALGHSNMCEVTTMIKTPPLFKVPPCNSFFESRKITLLDYLGWVILRWNPRSRHHVGYSGSKVLRYPSFYSRFNDNNQDL